jgi:hypothetical protein
MGYIIKTPTGGGGGGDATAANQLLQLAQDATAANQLLQLAQDATEATLLNINTDTTTIANNTTTIANDSSTIATNTFGLNLETTQTFISNILNNYRLNPPQNLVSQFNGATLATLTTSMNAALAAVHSVSPGSVLLSANYSWNPISLQFEGLLITNRA